MPVTPAYVAADPDLRAFVEGEAAHSVYHLVHLSVSFAAEPASPRLESTTIELRLSSADSTRQPVAWSMCPLRVASTARVERRFRLGPELKLQGLEMSVGEVERASSAERTEIFLQAQRELRSDPAWEFRRTRTMSLYGSYRLIMVVRAARGQTAIMAATVRAATKGNLLRRYGRELAEPLPLVAAL